MKKNMKKFMRQAVWGVLALAMFLCVSQEVKAQSCTPPPTCTGGNVMQFDGTHFTCVSLATLIPKSSAGILCGFSSSDHAFGEINVVLCQGMDPMHGCPVGYSQHIMFQADSNFLYTCLGNGS